MRIAEVEQESRQMIELAGVGMMVEVVAHELARASENALENLQRLQKENFSRETRNTLEGLQAQMKSLSKRVRILDPLSISGRQRAESFDLIQLVRETFSAHSGQFTRHSINVDIQADNAPLKIRAVKGMIVQIIENLISNSKHWLDMKKNRQPNFSPTITVCILSNPTTIMYSDNGTGIAPEHRECIFKPFFSLKEKTKRRGLGLYIARECAEHNGGRLFLSDEASAPDGRLRQFIFELEGSSI